MFRVPLVADAARPELHHPPGRHQGPERRPVPGPRQATATRSGYVSGQARTTRSSGCCPSVGRGVGRRPDQGAGALDRPRHRRRGRSSPTGRAVRTPCAGRADGGITARTGGVVGRPARSGCRTTRDGLTAAQLAAKWPHLAGYQVFKVRTQPTSTMVPEALRGQVVAVETARRAAPCADATVGADPRRARRPLRRRGRGRGPRADVRGGDADPARCGRPPPRTARAAAVRQRHRRGPPARSLAMTPRRRQRRVDRHRRRDLDGHVLPLRGRGLRPQHAAGRHQPRSPTRTRWPVHEQRRAARSSTSTDPALKPAGWDDVAKPPLAAPEDIALYELHVRDFRVNDATVPEPTSAAPSRPSPLDGSNGMKHLEGAGRRRPDPRAPAAGVRHRHRQRGPSRPGSSPAGDLAALPARLRPAAGRASAAVADQDGFNWGYDPLPLHRARGQLRDRPGRRDAHRRVPRDGAGAERRPACAW